MWTHKTKFKGHKFLGNYEMSVLVGTSTTIQIFKLKNVNTGREIEFRSYQAAQKAGWVRS